MPEGGWVTATEARQCPADANFIYDASGSRTHNTRRFGHRPAGRPVGRRRFANCVPRLLKRQSGILVCIGPRPSALAPRPSQASPMGFEPTISTVTGWRALQAAPRGPASPDWASGRPSNEVRRADRRRSPWVDSNHRSSSCKEAAFAARPQSELKKWTTPGIAPGSPVCRTGVFLLDDVPVFEK
jgi:hypothetical protein